MNVLDPDCCYPTNHNSFKIDSAMAISVTSVQSGFSGLHTQVYNFTFSSFSNFIITMIDLLRRERHDISIDCYVAKQSHETNEQ